jgi:2-iminobutanoate/2-iminopropanoate deaminase
MSSKTAISTDKAPKPAATYSQGVRKGNILQIAGQVPIDPATGNKVGETVGEQTRQVFANLNAILAEAGASMDDVVMLRVYLTDHGHFAEMNKVFAEFVSEPYPARTTVSVGLAPGLLVEIDALAVVGD